MNTRVVDTYLSLKRVVQVLFKEVLMAFQGKEFLFDGFKTDVILLSALNDMSQTGHYFGTSTLQTWTN